MGQRGIDARAKGWPYHTSETEEHPVYHVHSRCPSGWDIAEVHLRCGGWGRELCKRCEELIYQEWLDREARKTGR